MVIDTSIFIEYLRSPRKSETTLFKLADQDDLCLSAVSLYELQMGATDQTKEIDVRLLTEDLTILPFTAEVAIQAGRIYHTLRKRNQLIEFRDIFIAATCLVYDQPIQTLNKKHFKRVDDLKILR